MAWRALRHSLAARRNRVNIQSCNRTSQEARDCSDAGDMDRSKLLYDLALRTRLGLLYGVYWEDVELDRPTHWWAGNAPFEGDTYGEA